MLAAGKTLPNLKELTCGCLHVLVHNLRAFSFEKKPMELCLCQQGGISLPRSIRTLVVLVVLTAEQVPARSRAQRLVALASEF